MADYKARIEELAELMQEFRLNEARLRTGELTIAFRRRPSPRSATVEDSGESSSAIGYEEAPTPTSEEPTLPKGIPITSPMTGIFYASPSPGSGPFLREGAPISAGQTVGLIEAMKVFNEIPSPLSGMVLQIVAQSGQIVNPGDVLVYVG